MTKFAFVTKISHENSYSTISYQSGMLSFFRKKAWAYLFRAIYDHLLDFTSPRWQIFVTVFETDARCSRINFLRFYGLLIPHFQKRETKWQSKRRMLQLLLLFSVRKFMYKKRVITILSNSFVDVYSTFENSDDLSNCEDFTKALRT